MLHGYGLTPQSTIHDPLLQYEQHNEDKEREGGADDEAVDPVGFFERGDECAGGGEEVGKRGVLVGGYGEGGCAVICDG